jgi:hypothetical protein
MFFARSYKISLTCLSEQEWNKKTTKHLQMEDGLTPFAHVRNDGFIRRD